LDWPPINRIYRWRAAGKEKTELETCVRRPRADASARGKFSIYIDHNPLKSLDLKK
jgi:hypothetical protein